MFHLGKKTVASVMSAFNKAIDDLQQVEQEHAAEAERQRQLAVEAESAAKAAQAEAEEAERVRARLSDLVRGTVTGSFDEVAA